MRLKGKTAFVSGAGRNLGKAIALAFAREGADVILVARERQQNLNETASQCEALGRKALPILADMSKHEEVNHAARLALDRFGKVDILMCVAGIRPHKLPWEYDYDEWHQVYALNVHSAFYLTKALVPIMIERGKGGSIIALGGMAAVTAMHGKSAAHTSAKHGLYGFIKSLAKALGPHNIRANLLNPGTIESERVNPEWYSDVGGNPQTAAALAGTPLGRFGKSSEVADAAVFLASDESSYVTGDRLLCNGGQYM